MKLLMYIALGLVIFVIGTLAFLSVMVQDKPVAKGVSSSGDLSSCGDKPNCISTFDSRENFKAEPIKLTEGKSISDVEKAITSVMNTEVKVSRGNYRHLVFKTDLFRFPDDLELLVKDSFLHYRSQSRAGRKDLGVNSKRMKHITNILAEAGLID